MRWVTYKICVACTLKKPTGTSGRYVPVSGTREDVKCVLRIGTKCTSIKCDCDKER